MGHSDVDHQRLPTVSIAVPTYNSGRVLEACLESVRSQDYPGDLLEVIIADAGSTDETLAIAKRFTDRIFSNPLQTGEAGKAVAARQARHELVAFIDSDNILPDPNWLRAMVAPFRDARISASEPIAYTYRPTDGYITRYCALMGMNDPICYFLGNYDRMNMLSGSWTGLAVSQTDKESYLEVALEAGALPTIGANGFVIRKDVLFSTQFGDYLFDIDVMAALASKGTILLAKVKTGIIHVFCGDLATFSRKQKRRIRDYRFYRRAGVRSYDWQSMNRRGIAKFALYSITILPLLVQSLRGYAKFRDTAWFFHVPACMRTFQIYVTETVTRHGNSSAFSRESWK